MKDIYIDDKLRELKIFCNMYNLIIKEVSINKDDFNDLKEYLRYYNSYYIKKNHKFIDFMGFRLKKI